MFLCSISEVESEWQQDASLSFDLEAQHEDGVGEGISEQQEEVFFLGSGDLLWFLQQELIVFVFLLWLGLFLYSIPAA